MTSVSSVFRKLCQRSLVGLFFTAVIASAADFSLSNINLESSERVFGIPATWDLTYRDIWARRIFGDRPRVSIQPVSTAYRSKE